MKLHKQIHFKQHTSKGGIVTIIPWKTTESIKIVQFICIICIRMSMTSPP